MNLKALKLAFAFTTIPSFPKLLLLEIAKGCDAEGNSKITVNQLSDQLNVSPQKILWGLFQLSYGHGAIDVKIKMNIETIERVFGLLTHE